MNALLLKLFLESICQKNCIGTKRIVFVELNGLCSTMGFLSFIDCHFIINMILIFMHNQGIIFQLFELDLNFASWLVRSTPDRAVKVRTLAGEQCVVFLGKTLYSHSASFHPGVQMGTGEFNAGGDPVMD